jgi:hypothetical protein
VEVGDVEKPGCHDRGEARLENVVDEPTEIFDDLCLDRRAGGDRAAGSASTWRKAFLLGASLSGPSGSASLLGGLIFGRGRKA